LVSAPANLKLRAGFRRDIHGLRAVAVLLVLAYHSGLPVPGGFVGVDVFFVISGFLITNHLAYELTSTSKLNFARFYARRARRILPAALTVAGLTVIGALAVLPTELVKSSVQDAIATVLYVPNVLFAIRGTDYLAETAPSAFQHYWSLGIEEQFYLFWPIMLFLVWRLVKSSRFRVAVIAAVVITSLLVSIYWVEVNGPGAFFLLPSRAWELGAGALIALTYGTLQSLRPASGALLAWLGIALILISALSFGEGTPFPGVAALIPVLGAVCVIAFGGVAGDLGPLRLLRVRAFQFTGTISYSLYLVHWPLLVMIPYIDWISPEFEPLSKVLTALLVVPIAWLLYRYVERPFIQGSITRVLTPRRTLLYTLSASVTVMTLALLSLAGAGLRPTDAGREATPIVQPTSIPSNPPSTQFSDFVPSNLKPSLAHASESLPDIYSNGCHLSAKDVQPLDCSIGDVSSSRSIALFGDSHAAQWFPALAAASETDKFVLHTFTKSSCPSVLVEVLLHNVRYRECDGWRDAVIERINELAPEAVVISNLSRYVGLDGQDISPSKWQQGYIELRQRLDSEIHIVVIADTPYFSETPALCLERHLESALECALPRSEAIDWRFNAASEEVSRQIQAKFVDLTDYFCDAYLCGSIVGSTLLYRDAHHISVEYSRFLSTVVGESLALP
jgi:peptidoglycan/LPS O-acetylase OafA/YrhL